MALRDRLLGDPRTLDAAGLGRGVRRGSEAFAVRCVRWIGERGDLGARSFLEGLLRDQRAALRRASAWALAWLGPAGSRGALEVAWAEEWTEEGRLALAVARALAGEPAERVRADLAALDARVLQTPQGPRAPSLVTEVGALVERFDLVMAGPRAALLTSRRRALAERGGRVDLLGLASLRHPDDVPLLLGRIDVSGRREEHALLLALGWTGAPEVVAPLTGVLRATDVDPGRGFAQRRLAATSLGRVGLQESGAVLVRALEDEAFDYEGRPGAGLGIQYPVRGAILWALGELGDPTIAPTLIEYLGNTSGSAFGGFYLPAMDALVRIGPAVLPAVRAAVAKGSDEVAAHGLGVIHALGGGLAAWVDDPRPTVRALARRLEGR